jgi:hypothetical protein
MPRLRSVEITAATSAVSSLCLVGWTIAAVLLAGCGTQLPGVISPDGYASGRYALGVRKGYDVPAAAGLMPEGWKLDNFNDDEPKQGKAYQTTIRIDANNDGDFEQQEDGPAFELRFVHLRHAGVVWLRTVPVSADLATKDLRVLTEGYVEALAGGQYETTEIDQGGASTLEKRFASTLLSAEPCQLAAQECEAATLELANVDQLKLDPKYRSNKLMVVITRTPFVYWPRMRRSHHPVYLVAGYSNQPGQFDAGLPDFVAFLQHIDIGGSRGFKASSPTSATAPAPAAAPDAATAPAPAAAPAPGADPAPAAAPAPASAAP